MSSAGAADHQHASSEAKVKPTGPVPIIRSIACRVTDIVSAPAAISGSWTWSTSELSDRGADVMAHTKLVILVGTPVLSDGEAGAIARASPCKTPPTPLVMAPAKRTIVQDLGDGSCCRSIRFSWGCLQQHHAECLTLLQRDGALAAEFEAGEQGAGDGTALPVGGILSGWRGRQQVFQPGAIRG